MVGKPANKHRYPWKKSDGEWFAQAHFCRCTSFALIAHSSPYLPERAVSKERGEMMLRLREVTEEERKTIERLVHARNTPVGKLKRAQIIWLASQRESTPEIAKQLEVSERMVRNRLHRFNEQGLQGLEEAPRSGRPMTYTPEEVSSIIQTALSNPRDLGEDYATWTLDRLVDYLHRVKGIRMKRSRIS